MGSVTLARAPDGDLVVLKRPYDPDDDACERLRDEARIGARLLQTDEEHVTLVDGAVVGPSGSVTLAEIASAYHLSPADLPDDIDSRGLEATEGYAPEVRTGVHTGATHAANPRPR